jgi:T5SS/PEP-CTERM-associated repeat protein/autotransporter passenger strand-loop-strand repeat protein
MFYDVTPANPISGVTLNSGDAAVVLSGGVAKATTLKNGSVMTVSSGGVGSFTTLSGGFEFVSSGGVVSDTVISGGTEAVSSGGVADFSVVSGDGAQAVYAGGSAVGAVLSGGLQAVYAGGSVSGTVVSNGGGDFVYAGGAATATVLSSGGAQSLLGGVASETVASNGGTLTVDSGGLALSATISNGGAEIVVGGGVASFTIVSSGGSESVSGGTVSFTVVSGGGTEIVAANGVANGTLVSGLFAAQIVSSGGTASGTVLSGTFPTETVSSGGVAMRTTVRDGYLYVSSGGAASFTVLSNGFTVVSRGGTVLSSTVTGGFEQVSFSGVANATTVLAGFQQVYSGGTASGTTVIGGYQQVLSGGMATATIVSGAGTQQVRGGTASGTVVDGGFEIVSSGGTVSGTVLHGGSQTVYSGSLASGTILSGGGETVLSGGVVRSTVVSSGGIQTVSSGGSASGTTVSAYGFEVLASGGSASDTVVNSGGRLTVSAGGSASFVTVSSGGSIDFPQRVYSGGSAAIGGSDGLSVVEGGTSATLQLAGNYVSRAFQTARDGGGGTVITLEISPRTMVWNGDQDTNFGNGADWNDVTNGLDPATAPPGAADSAQFLTGGGTITGTGTVSELEFAGISAWELTSGASFSAQVGVTVGQTGSGTLLVSGGASIAGLGSSDDISGSSGGVASVTVAGSGSRWKSSGELVVGNLGTGNLSVTNSANVSATAAGSLPAMSLGAGTSGSGALTVTGVGSEATLVGQLDVGQAGGGILTVSNQGTVETGNDPGLNPSEGFDIAQLAGGSGVANVTGTASLLNNIGEFIVGDAGLGSLSITAGATVTTAPGTGGTGLVIANAASASGSSVDVSGAGSDLAVTGTVIVGDSGSGALSLSQGATVIAGALDVAAAATGDGNVSLSGTGTTLDVTGALTLGGAAAGELSILGGARMTVAGGVVGSSTTAPGNLDVEGTGSQLTINTGTLTVGANGPAEFTLGIGATLQGEVANGPFGVVNEYGNVDPQTDPNDGTQNVGFGNSLIYDFFVANSGTIKITSGTATFYTPLVTDETNAQDGSTNGLWVIGAHDTLVMNATSVDNTQTFDFTSPSAASLVIGQVPQGNPAVPDTYNGQTMPSLTGSIAPGSPNVLPGWNAPIENYQSGDVIVLQGLTYRSATASGDVVTVWSGAGGTGTPLGSLTFLSKSLAPSSSEAAAAATQINALACFAAGTRIETVDGPVAVEELRVGDEVRTVLGGPGRIVWVGSRAVDCTRHPWPETVWPVRVSAGAFGPEMPRRDLFLSPDHAVFVDSILVPVKHLLNGSTVRQVKRRRVEYHHVELACHDVVLAEGLPTETYLDTGDRAKFSGGGVTALHPDFTARTWEMSAVAPLIVTGPELVAVRRRVNALAAAIGGVAVA